MAATKQNNIAKGIVGGIKKFEMTPMIEKPPNV